MKNRFRMIAAILVSAALMSACSKQDGANTRDKPLDFAALEDARGTARANAEWNAATYRKQYPGYSIVSRGDSTQTEVCPQGDGWASIDLVSAEAGQPTIKLVCSTVSGNIGCLEKKDFETKSYANENNQCQATTRVPYPLPKIAK